MERQSCVENPIGMVLVSASSDLRERAERLLQKWSGSAIYSHNPEKAQQLVNEFNAILAEAKAAGEREVREKWMMVKPTNRRAMTPKECEQYGVPLGTELIWFR